MGQAKLRGSLEQRKAEAIAKAKERELQEAKERMVRASIGGNRRGKSQLNMLIAASIAAGWGNIES